MKKFLLSSTAILSLLAGVAMAEVSNPTASFEGLADFQAGFRSQKKAYKQNLSDNQSDVRFDNTAKLAAKVEGKADIGFNYGAVVGLKTTSDKNRRVSTSNLDRTYVFVESEAGRFELGSNYSAAKAMKFDAGTLARGNGGVNGDWYKYYNFGTSMDLGYGVDSFVNSPDNFVDYLNKWSDEDTRKVTFYTPRMSGFQLGLSYTPDAKNKGNSEQYMSQADKYYNFNKDSNSLKVKNLFSGGLNYMQQFEQMTLSLSATGETGKVNNVSYLAGQTNTKNINSYAFGGNVEYAGLTFGGSWGVMGKKNFASNVMNSTSDDASNASMLGINKDVKYWTAGVGMVQGPVGASLNYFQSDLKGSSTAGVGFHNTMKALVLDVDYQLTAGMLPYATVAMLDPKMKMTGTPSPKNRGTVFLVGTQFKF